MSNLNQQPGLWPFIGQEELGGYILRALSNGRLPRAILFGGPHALGKASAAVWLTRVSICRSKNNRPCEQCIDCRQSKNYGHPRQIIIRPTGRDLIKIEEVRRALRRFIVAGTPGLDRWLVIIEAEQMTESASNILLKFVEELPAQTRIIMTSSRPDELLPTLKSRLTAFYWHLIPSQTFRKITGQTADRVHRAAGRPGWFVNATAGDQPSKMAFVGLNTVQAQTSEGSLPFRSTDRDLTNERLKIEELQIRELLLAACDSQHRRLWPTTDRQTKVMSDQLGIRRLCQSAEKYLERHQYSPNIQPRLLYEDLHLV